MPRGSTIQLQLSLGSTMTRRIHHQLHHLQLLHQHLFPHPSLQLHQLHQLRLPIQLRHQLKLQFLPHYLLHHLPRLNQLRHQHPHLFSQLESMSVTNGNLARPQFALRDHSLALAMCAPLRVIIVHAVTEEKCAGGHLAQILVEDQDLLPRLHPSLLLEVALSVLPLESAVMHLTRVLITESQAAVDAFHRNRGCKA